jgi:CheY-like chemotaxis protein
MDETSPTKRRGNGKGKGIAHGSKPQISVTAVLDKLDAVDDSRFRNRRRGGARHRFRRTEVSVRVRHPGGSLSAGTAATRNLSNTGICFIYQSFLHLGSQVSVTLPRRLGGEDEIEGTVVYCRHIVGTHHQIGMRFEHKIFAKLYADDDAVITPTPAAAPAPFAGTMLLIDPQPMDRAMVSNHLRGTGARVVATESLEAAIAVLLSSPVGRFDVVLCDIDVASLGKGIGATLEGLRGSGHGGAVVVVTATAANVTIRRALTEAGAIASIAKPYDREQLLTTLSHAVANARVDKAIAAAERGVREVDSLVKTCRETNRDQWVK